jgi:hypothetical protein
MKVILFLITIFSLVVNSNAQSIDKNTFNVRIGGNATAGLTLTTVSSNGVKSDVDSSGVLATQIPVLFEYGVFKFLSLNAGFQAGSWLNEDPNDNNIVIKEKRVRQFNLGAKLYPVNKDNFNLYFGFQLGIGSFNTEKENKGLIVVNEKQRWAGTNSNLSLGMNWYYGGKFGSYFQMGYSGYQFNLKEFTLGNADMIDTFNLDADMRIKGIHVELGLCYKFGG